VSPASGEALGARWKFVIGARKTDEIDSFVQLDWRHQLQQRYVQIERLWS